MQPIYSILQKTANLKIKSPQFQYIHSMYQCPVYQFDCFPSHVSAHIYKAGLLASIQFNPLLLSTILSKFLFAFIRKTPFE